MSDQNSELTTGVTNIDFQPEAAEHLDEARKWSGFLAILGFIGLGFLVLAAIVAIPLMLVVGRGEIPFGLGMGMIFFYLALGVAYFFPVYYLFQFSQKSKKAVKENNSGVLTEAIKYLKSHYKFVGIMSIALLVLYPLIIMCFVLLGVLGNL